MQIKELNLYDFLNNNRISRSDWDQALISWESLLEIGLHHLNRANRLNEDAEYLAKKLQKCSHVHSVRWRVKDPEHLMVKIFNKRIEGSEKYRPIDVNNYDEIITDLIGVRALHLFKDEWKDVQEYIIEELNLNESIAYIREGDEKEIISSYKDGGCEVKVHPKGYRSVHYIISLNNSKKTTYAEIQVRTIFEEGWSEIDHKLRYPNFPYNDLIDYFLTVFNRLAGSADEMGIFVKKLAEDASIDKFNEIDKLVSDLSNEKDINQAIVSGLKCEIARLKNVPAIDKFSRLNRSTFNHLRFAIQNWMENSFIKIDENGITEELVNNTAKKILSTEVFNKINLSSYFIENYVYESLPDFLEQYKRGFDLTKAFTLRWRDANPGFFINTNIEHIIEGVIGNEDFKSFSKMFDLSSRQIQTWVTQVVQESSP